MKNITDIGVADGVKAVAHCPRKRHPKVPCSRSAQELGATAASCRLGRHHVAFDLLNVLLGDLGHLLGRLARLCNGVVASFHSLLERRHSSFRALGSILKRLSNQLVDLSVLGVEVGFSVLG